MSIKIIFCIFHFSLKLYIKHMNSSLNVFPYSYSSSVLRPQWAQQTAHWTATNSSSEPSEKKSGELWIKRKLGEWNNKKTGVSSEEWRDCQVCTNSPSLSYIYLSCPSPACLYLTLNTLHRKSTFTYWLLEKHSKHVEKVPASFIQ